MTSLKNVMMTRYILIDNAIVRSDDIKDYQEIDTKEFFLREKRTFTVDDYLPCFTIIKDFVSKVGQKIEIFASTHFYLVPCFISELQDFLGPSVKVYPIRILINDVQFREIYDHHVVETVVNLDGSMSIDMIEEDIMKNVAGKQCEKYLQRGGMPGIISFNEKIETEVGEWLTLESIELGCILDESYRDLINAKEGYSLFSPYASLLFYDQIIPGIKSIENICNEKVDGVTSIYSYRLLTKPETPSFKDSFRNWVLVEKQNRFSVVRTVKDGNSKTCHFSIPNSYIEATELQVQELSFGKFYLELICDFFGQLHVKVYSLNNKVYYDIIQF